MRCRIDVTLTDEPPIAQAIVVITGDPCDRLTATRATGSLGRDQLEPKRPHMGARQDRKQGPGQAKGRRPVGHGPGP